MFESEKTFMAVDPVLTSTFTNTKPKKKRNRKKKKKGITASATSTNITKTNTNKNNILTPQEMLRIDKMMGEMLDQGLPYDEYNAVLNYLQSSSERRSSSDVSITVGVKTDVDDDADVDIDGRNNIKEVDTKVTEPELSSPSSQPSDGGGRSDKEKEQDTNNGDVITFKNNDEDEEEKEEESQPTKSPITMTTRLAMVAEFEDLTDAIMALTQWVNKAVTLEEIEDLCRAEKTSALSTIVRRGISTEVVTDPTTFESSFVQPGLVDLLVSILHRCGVEFDKGERMEHMLQQARKVSLLGATSEQDEFEEDADNDVVEQVATFIVSRIGLMMTMTQ